MEFSRYYKLDEKLVTLRNIVNNDFKLIKDIESHSYPEHMRSFDDMDNIEEVMDYYEIEDYDSIKIYIDDNHKWYLFLIEDKNNKELEIADLAGEFGGGLLSKLKGCFNNYKDWVISADLRESTSYRLLQIAERYGKVEVISSRKWRWGNENMYEVKFKFKDFLNEEMIYEDITSNLGQSAAILRGSNKSKEAVELSKNKIKELSALLTEPYVNLPAKEGGEHIHLPLLVTWIRDGIPVDQVKQEYDNFMNLPKEIKSNFNLKKMNSFKQFYELVHKYISKTMTKDKVSSNELLEKIRHDKDVQDAKRYEDENVVIYEGTTLETTRKLAQKDRYGYCIGAECKPGEDHYFYTYRIKYDQTTYFVYFKNEECTKNYNVDDKSLLIIDVRRNPDWLEMTDTNNNPEETNWNNVLRKFPCLSVPKEQDIFKYTLPNEEIIKTLPGEYSYTYANNILKWKDVPQDLMKNIINDPYSSYRYANDILKWKNVPSEIIKSISKDSDYSFMYANDVLNWKNVPQEIIRGISNSTYTSYKYANDILKWENVPPEIIKSISKDSEYSFRYFNNNPDRENVPPEIFKSISNDPEYSYKYATNIMYFKAVPPEIINSISKHPEYSFMYADRLKWKDVPQEIIRGISGSPDHSFMYADRLNWENVPQEIIRGISSGPYTAYRYANNILKWKDVPQEIIRGISNDPGYSYRYANNILKWKDVPQEIIKSISSDPYTSYRYANDILKWENVPPEIIKSISNDPDYAVKYADRLNWKNVPSEIMDSIKRVKSYRDEIPVDVTVSPIQESVKVILPDRNIKTKITDIFN